MTGEVGGFDTHCSQLVAAAACRIWWKLWSWQKITSSLLFLWTRCVTDSQPLHCLYKRRIQLASRRVLCDVSDCAD